MQQPQNRANLKASLESMNILFLEVTTPPNTGSFGFLGALAVGYKKLYKHKVLLAVWNTAVISDNEMGYLQHIGIDVVDANEIIKGLVQVTGSEYSTILIDEPLSVILTSNTIYEKFLKDNLKSLSAVVITR